METTSSESEDRFSQVMYHLLQISEIKKFNQDRPLKLNLTDADLSDVNLTDADLANSNLTGANLSNSNLTNVNFSGADLSNVNLSDANLTNAIFRNSNLSGANLTFANLTNAIISGANLTNVGFDSKHAPNLRNIRIRKIDTPDYQKVLRKDLETMPDNFRKLILEHNPNLQEIWKDKG